MSETKAVAPLRPAPTTLLRRARHAWATVNDRVLNIRTIPSTNARASQASPRSEFGDGVAYEAPDYYYLRRLRRMLFRGSCENEVFYDLGSGMGRALCVMAQLPLRRVVGVELCPRLHALAHDNATALRGRRAPIELENVDVTSSDLSAGTTYYLFNPFGPRTLDSVLRKITCSLSDNPRAVRIVYYNSVHRQLFDSFPILRCASEFRTQSGLTVSLWKSPEILN